MHVLSPLSRCMVYWTGIQPLHMLNLLQYKHKQIDNMDTIFFYPKLMKITNLSYRDMFIHAVAEMKKVF